MKYFFSNYEIRDGLNEYHQSLIVEAESMEDAEKQLDEAFFIGESQNDSQEYVMGTMQEINQAEYDVLKRFVNIL